ncbi:hypothetical protein [Anaerocolumna xylanovorans]|uniref:Uncharacterized protein n=1 Tax=Anaerocolumna xylanovorans DSM 12503 TaxID=1121345 RepID=A0A1M7YL05_9FIRM|nr:hypothetical protein [Anaerocolumna xylanovorans]SHO53293.1 hypothetical protein SAMN02745217_04044 [Anaerocolumna xylanovorans DSM 12503]
MKKFTKVRYIIALLLVLATVSSIATPTRSTGLITTLGEPGFNWLLETR